MTPHDTERSPLLAQSRASKDGPLECREISCPTRYGILIALWAGTFLCVSPVVSSLLTTADDFQNLNCTWCPMRPLAMLIH